jgi:hypothetical protein
MISVPVFVADPAELVSEAMCGRHLVAYRLTRTAAPPCGPPRGMILLGWQPAALWING